MNENKQATEFTPEEIQTDVELTDEELEQASGGKLSLLDDVLCEECGVKKKTVSDPCPNMLCPSHHIA